MDAAHHGIRIENDPHATTTISASVGVSMARVRDEPGPTTAPKALNVAASDLDREGGRADPSRTVVVPRDPGPLVPVFAGDRPPDELDALIDEVFGPSPQARPGPFDVILVVVGIILFAWSLLGGSTLGLWLGAIAVLLGLALPLRALGRRRSARRENRLRKQALGRGLPLDTTDQVVRSLVAAYGALLSAAAARGPSDEMGAEAVASAHQAVSEVASLLEGMPPQSSAQVAYVRKRSQAIRGVTDAMKGKHASSAGSVSVASTSMPDDTLGRDAVVRAREELEKATGVGSVDQLGDLAARLGDRTRKGEEGTRDGDR